MTVLVTGAGGHIGSNLVRTLLDRGERVRTLDIRASPGIEGLPVDERVGSVLNGPELVEACRGVSVVYHLAAGISVTGNADVWELNTLGPSSVARAAAAAGADRMVHCSSVHSFDLEVGGALDEGGPRAIAPHLPLYDRSKWEGERLLRAIRRDLDVVVAYPTGVLGPHDFEPSRMGRILLALRDRRIPATVGGSFDWVDARDVAGGLIAAARDGRPGHGYLFGGTRASIRQLADLVASHTGVAAPRVEVPLWFASLWAPIATRLARVSGDPRLYTSDTLHALRHPPRVASTKAADELGFLPRLLEATMADTLDWHQHHSGRVRPPVGV